jgi:predicted MPP superfamily phosphohydrolase
MKLIWLTDIHLNFLDKQSRMDFYGKVIRTSGDSILISGDIAEAPSISEILTEMAITINKPIYFVLGNHDYYQGQINTVRQEMMDLTKNNPLLHWLPTLGAQSLGDQAILLGDDCWADGRYGNYAHSRASLNDSRMINDLYQSSLLGKYPLLEKMHQLADKDAKRLKGNLTGSITKYRPKKVVMLMHVPPFIEACMHEGKISSDDFLPFFVSKATGDVLAQIAQENPDIEFLGLCGHTHSRAYWQPYVNLTIRAGAAEYGKPEIQDLIDVCSE